MSDFKKILEEKVSREHRNQVMKAAHDLLKENEATSPSRRWFSVAIWSGLGMAMTAGLAAIVVWRTRDNVSTGKPPSEDFATATVDPEMLLEADLLAELEILEDLEELELWEDS